MNQALRANSKRARRERVDIARAGAYADASALAAEQRGASDDVRRHVPPDPVMKFSNPASMLAGAGPAAAPSAVEHTFGGAEATFGARDAAPRAADRRADERRVLYDEAKVVAMEFEMRYFRDRDDKPAVAKKPAVAPRARADDARARAGAPGAARVVPAAALRRAKLPRAPPPGRPGHNDFEPKDGRGARSKSAPGCPTPRVRVANHPVQDREPVGVFAFWAWLDGSCGWVTGLHEVGGGADERGSTLGWATGRVAPSLVPCTGQLAVKDGFRRDLRPESIVACDDLERTVLSAEGWQADAPAALVDARMDAKTGDGLRYANCEAAEHPKGSGTVWLSYAVVARAPSKCCPAPAGQCGRDPPQERLGRWLWVRLDDAAARPVSAPEALVLDRSSASSRGLAARAALSPRPRRHGGAAALGARSRSARGDRRAARLFSVLRAWLHRRFKEGLDVDDPPPPAPAPVAEEEEEGVSRLCMRFQLDELDVFFPYDALYPEQFTYICELKKALDAEGHALLEMPTGTGKTACLLTLITAYQYAHPEMGKLIYCSGRCRDGEVPRGAQAPARVPRRAARRGRVKAPFLALCLSSRRNMCVHERVVRDADRDRVDVECRKMTASWARSRDDAEKCPFFEAWDEAGTEAEVPDGVYDVDDLRVLGKAKGWCPYFLARHAIAHANVIVYNYQYMLDPKVAGLVSRELEAESVVVFDEGHNIDNICIEALSVELDARRLDQAQRCVARLARSVDALRASDAGRVRAEYDRLVSGLRAGASGDELGGASPCCPRTCSTRPCRATCARPSTSCGCCGCSCSTSEEARRGVAVESPAAFLLGLQQATGLDAKPLKFFHTRLHQLLRTVEAAGLEDSAALGDVANVASIVSTYDDGFSVVADPTSRGPSGLPQARLDLACLDASLAIKPVLERFRSVVITSGTLSPLELYPKLLNFSPVVRESLQMSIFRPCILPLVVTKGADQQPVSTRLESRDDAAVVRNFGQLLAGLCGDVPDGMVVFFPSYSYMERTVTTWDELGVLRKVAEHKLLFVETKDVVETTIALDNFRRACDTGRGAVFLSIARGKVAEGIDFDRHYGRCVLNVGVPFQYACRCSDAARVPPLQVRHPRGRLPELRRPAPDGPVRRPRHPVEDGLRHRHLAARLAPDKRSKLPGWVQQFMTDANLNLSSDAALAITRTFLKQMAQPIDDRDLRQMPRRPEARRHAQDATRAADDAAPD
ncbi:ATP-dependent DNA helicase [Aureococcus anophagefferens]|nr:ATP-dependent DNA helicase [Aureococcus anophagefferens]